MRVSSLLLLLSAVACAYAGLSSPLFKVFTQETPMYRGRSDPIVNPGVYSQHSHKVFGGNNFGMFSPSDTPMAVYKSMFASNCTSTSITIDKSAYWIPDLYYRWPDGSFQLVPTGGLTVYYEGRRGDGAQANPKWTAFPPGFRMIAGNPFRRSYNESVVGQTGLTYACLASIGNPETHAFPTDKLFCLNGLRTQVYFPMCWDGINLDSPTHESHVAYPLDRYDNGNCPTTHPVRLPGLFYEVLYSVDKFPHGQGVQPFVWACGDPTGYGLHGDFLNGWDSAIMQNALNDLSCYANITNNGNNPENCKPFTQYVKKTNTDQTCHISMPINNYEDYGVSHKISHLPGCNPVDSGPADVKPCMGSWPVKILTPNLSRVLIKSQKNNLFVSARSYFAPLTADSPANIVYGANAFEVTMLDKSTYVIQSEITLQYVSANNRADTPIIANRPTYDTWEKWNITYMGADGPTEAGTKASIMSYSDNLYVVTQANGQLIANSQTPEYFLFIDANAGVPDTRTIKF